MKSLQRRFYNITLRQTSWSTFVCFAEAIKGRKFNRQTIHRWFYKLVNKDDYSPEEVKELFEYLDALTNSPEDDKKSA